MSKGKDIYDVLGDIFDPNGNPFFVANRNDDNIEDAEIIAEIKE